MSVVSESFYRCYKALHLVTLEAAPCVEDSLKTWHSSQQQVLSPCAVRCPAGKKPKLPVSCSNCVAWANAIESVYYQPTVNPSTQKKQITWQNVNSSNFHKSHVEVAKSFVLRLPKVAPVRASTTIAQTQAASAVSAGASASASASSSSATPAAVASQSVSSSSHSAAGRYNNVTDFDSASLLMIMARFGEFHKGDQRAYELIEKVSAIRNQLSHMALGDNMTMEKQRVTEVFTILEEFVNWLAKMYPQFLKTSQDIKDHLTEIRSEPVTKRMKESFLQDELRVLSTTLKDVCAKREDDDRRLRSTELKLDRLTEKDKDIEQNLSGAVAKVQIAEEKIENVVVDLQEKIENVVVDLQEGKIKLAHAEEEIETLSLKATDIEQGLASASQAINRMQQVGIATKQLESRVDEVSCATKDVEQRLQVFREEVTAPKDEIPFDEDRCRKHLMDDYQESRGKLPLFPGMPEEFADIDKLYVNLELVEAREEESKVLKSYKELFTLKNKDGKLRKRILIRGGPGGGKTTIVSKIAYDWSKEQKHRCLSECKLLFVLDLRDVEPGMSVIDAVRDHCLPYVSSQGLFDYLTANAASIVFVLDGYDEAPWIGDVTSKSIPRSNQFEKLLQNKWLQESLVLVTSRPHRVSTYVSRFKICTHVQLTELTKYQITKYINKFFNVPPNYIDFVYYSVILEESDQDVDEDDLPVHVNEAIAEAKAMLTASVKAKSEERRIAQIPILLTMLCVLWKEERSLPDRITDVFDAAVHYLAKHAWVKVQTEDNMNEDLLERDVHETLVGVGEVALAGLLQDELEGRLVFNDSRFQSDVLDKAVKLGIVTKERSKAKRFRTQHHITFLHKTFQEFCAAKYLANLEHLDREDFDLLLYRVNPSNVRDINYMMQFCCGLSQEAATKIIPHIVRVLQNTSFIDNSDWFPRPITLDCSLIASENLWTPALLLLHESQSARLHGELNPLFERERFTLTLGNHEERLEALDYFLDCKIEASNEDDKAMTTITNVKVDFNETSDQPLQVCGKFLRCLSNLKSLSIELHDKSEIFSTFDSIAESLCQSQYCTHLTLKDENWNWPNLDVLIKSLSMTTASCVSVTNLKISFRDLDASLLVQFFSVLQNVRNMYLTAEQGCGVVAYGGLAEIRKTAIKAGGTLQSLKYLTLSGKGDLTALFVVLGADRSTCRNVTDLTISCTEFCVSDTKRFLSQLVNLRNFSLLGERSPSNEVQAQRNIAEQLFNSLVSKKLRTIHISYYPVPGKSLQPLLTNVLTLQCEYLSSEATETLFSVLYDTSRKRFSEFRSGRSQSPLHLKQLRLHRLEVTSARLLVKAFRYMPRLTVLNLKNSGMKGDSVILVGNALPTLKGLKELNLSDTYNLTNQHDVSILVARNIAKLPQLEKLLLRRFFDGKGLCQLGNSLHCLPKLKCLKLSKNPARSEMRTFLSGFPELHLLEELNLRNTNLSDDDLAHFPVKSMPNLTQLDIGGECIDKKMRETKRLELEWLERYPEDAKYYRTSDDPLRHIYTQQMYTAEGLRLFFTNLHFLKKLTHLSISSDEKWLKDSEFWRQCCQHCLAHLPEYMPDEKEEDDFHRTLKLSKKEIESVHKFALDYPNTVS